jgi:hypothetical protein
MAGVRAQRGISDRPMSGQPLGQPGTRRPRPSHTPLSIATPIGGQLTTCLSGTVVAAATYPSPTTSRADPDFERPRTVPDNSPLRAILTPLPTGLSCPISVATVLHHTTPPRRHRVRRAASPTRTSVAADRKPRARPPHSGADRPACSAWRNGPARRSSPITGGSGSLFNIDWWQFGGAVTSTTPP